MARPTEWRRTFANYIEDVADYFHAVKLGDLLEGETLTRVRWRYQCQHVIGTAGAESVGITLGAGIILGPTGTSSPPANPLTDPNADWLWWEASFALPHRVQNDDGTTFELDVWPSDPGERDVKAQRAAATGGSSVWIVFEAPSEFSAQDVFYASYSASWLVILPAS